MQSPYLWPPALSESWTGSFFWVSAGCRFVLRWVDFFFTTFSFFSKLKIVGTASFLRFSRRGLNVEPGEVLIARFCWKQSAVKWSAQMRECLVGSKDSLFIFISHSFLSFGSSGNKVLTLDFKKFWTWGSEPPWIFENLRWLWTSCRECF